VFGSFVLRVLFMLPSVPVSTSVALLGYVFIGTDNIPNIVASGADTQRINSEALRLTVAVSSNFYKLGFYVLPMSPLYLC